MEVAINYTQSVIDLVQAAGFTGLLVILAVPKTRQWFGFTNGNGHQEQIDTLKANYASLAEQVKHIEEKIMTIAGDVSFIRGRLSK